MMDTLADFHFLRPAWLLLAPVAAAIWWWWRKASDPLRGWRAQIEPDLLQALVRERETDRRQVWLLVAWLLAVFAVAGPTWQRAPSPFADDAAPMMILLQADRSMDAPAPAPSRMERARLKVADLAELRKGRPLGLMAYAGSAHLVLPPTRDTEVVARMAAEISPEIMPKEGDRLDLALQAADDLLSQTGGMLVVVAGRVDTPPSKLPDTRAKVQFLSLTSEDSPEAASTQAAAKTLDASVEFLTADRADVTRLAKRAERIRVNQTEEAGARWQEAGYWLLPFIAGVVAWSFRRETLTLEPSE